LGVHFLSGLLKPSGPNIFMTIKLRHIWLDVKQWCAVHDVYILDVKNAVLDPVQLDYGQTDGIRPFGGTSGKETPERWVSMNGTT